MGQQLEGVGGVSEGETGPGCSGCEAICGVEGADEGIEVVACVG
jgi:hypothetical protein